MSYITGFDLILFQLVDYQLLLVEMTKCYSENLSTYLSSRSQKGSALYGYLLPPGSEPQFYLTRTSLSIHPQCKNLRNADPLQANSKETDE